MTILLLALKNQRLYFGKYELSSMGNELLIISISET